MLAGHGHDISRAAGPDRSDAICTFSLPSGSIDRTIAMGAVIGHLWDVASVIQTKRVRNRGDDSTMFGVRFFPPPRPNYLSSSSQLGLGTISRSISWTIAGVLATLFHEGFAASLCQFC
jgi:hypothetical protein